jgi:hypothetical protein
MAHRSGGGSKVRKWRKYSVNGFELGQLNGEAVVTWREEGKRRRFRLSVHTELEGRAALDRWARRQGAIALRQPKNVGELWSDYITDRTKDGKVIANMHYHWKALGPRFAKLSPDDIDADVCRDYAKVRKADGRDSHGGSRRGDASHLPFPRPQGPAYHEYNLRKAETGSLETGG